MHLTKKIMYVGVLWVSLVLCSACSTSTAKDEAGIGHFYNGTSYAGEITVCNAKSKSMNRVLIPLNLIDIIVSFVGDTLLIPVDILGILDKNRKDRAHFRC